METNIARSPSCNTISAMLQKVEVFDVPWPTEPIGKGFVYFQGVQIFSSDLFDFQGVELTTGQYRLSMYEDPFLILIAGGVH